MMQQMLAGMGGSSGVATSNEYLYLPLNESSSSRTKFGNYASSLTLNSGGGVTTSDHPYSITDSTYNSGNSHSHFCNGQSTTCYFNGNTILGSIGTGDIGCDFYYKWTSEGNGGGSYGYVGDHAGASLYAGSRSGLDFDNQFMVGAIAGDVKARYRYGGTNEDFNSSLTTNGSGMNVWYHVLIIRKDNKWWSFVDGVLDGYFAEPSARNIANGGGFHFGTIDRSGHWWECRISDFMWQKGSDAFYSIDSSINSGNIGTTYFTKPQYKNKKMAIPSNSSFTIVKAPAGFTTE
tara:strand:+ start:29 stop:901 length:873 start_codon:yes stop_codon:yes gene_type:complete